MRADAQRNRARLLQAARECFAARGLSVPLDEIARQAGVGAGTMHRHFPTKESLYEAIVLTHVDALADEARGLADAPDAGQAFFDFCFSMIERSAANRALAEVLARSGTEVKARVAEVAAELDGHLDVLISRAQASGSIRSDVSMAEVRALLNSIHLAADSERGDSGLARNLMAVIQDGLRAGPRDRPASPASAGAPAAAAAAPRP